MLRLLFGYAMFTSNYELGEKVVWNHFSSKIMFYVTSLFLFGKCFGLFHLYYVCVDQNTLLTPGDTMSEIIEWMDSLLLEKLLVMEHSLKLELYSTFYSMMKDYISVPVSLLIHTLVPMCCWWCSGSLCQSEYYSVHYHKTKDKKCVKCGPRVRRFLEGRFKASSWILEALNLPSIVEEDFFSVVLITYLNYFTLLTFSLSCMHVHYRGALCSAHTVRPL